MQYDNIKPRSGYTPERGINPVSWSTVCFGNDITQDLYTTRHMVIRFILKKLNRPTCTGLYSSVASLESEYLKNIFSGTLKIEKKSAKLHYVLLIKYIKAQIYQENMFGLSNF